MRLAHVVAVLSLALTFDAGAASSQVQQAGRPAAAAIAVRNQEFMATFAKGDAAGLAALYSEDGQALPPNGTPIVGREAITAMWTSFLGMGLKSAVLETIDVAALGDVAAEQGRYKLALADGTIADEGKYIVLWKRVGDRWYLHRDMWSSNRPAPAK